MSAFNPGDTVRLKSDSPLMTVEEIFKDAKGREMVRCIEKNEPRSHAFPSEALVHDNGEPTFA